MSDLAEPGPIALVSTALPYCATHGALHEDGTPTTSCRYRRLFYFDTDEAIGAPPEGATQ